MANKRMINKTIIDSDAFLDMPQTTQNLYFHLNMRADDDGFLDNPKKVMRTIGSGQNDFEILLAKRYILMFDSGVIVIKHWRLHNTIRKDRYTETLYKEEKQLLSVKEDGAYTDNIKSLPDNNIEDVATNWQPDGNQLVTDGCRRLDKIRLDKSREEKKEKINKKESSDFSPFQPYDPKKNLNDLLNTRIAKWNSCENLPSCRYQSFNLPKIQDVIPKFDIFSVTEIDKAIDNLNNLWSEIDPRFRVTSLSNFFANDIIDTFVDDANPYERYTKPFKESNMTELEKKALLRYYLKNDKDCEDWNTLHEFMDSDYFRDYLERIGNNEE